MLGIGDLALKISSAIEKAIDQGYVLVSGHPGIYWSDAQNAWLDNDGNTDSPITCPIGAIVRIHNPPQVPAGPDRVADCLRRSTYANAARVLDVDLAWVNCFRSGFDGNAFPETYEEFKECHEAYSLGQALRERYMPVEWLLIANSPTTEVEPESSNDFVEALSA